MGADLLTPTHLLFLGLLALLLFGSKRLPEIGRSLGKGIREFKTTVSGLDGVTEAVNGVNEVRSAVSPSNIARAAIPGVADVQDTISATKGLVNPTAAVAGDTASAEAAEPADGPASSAP
jgi:sec-independent protein translocase protein TatA